MKIRTRFVTTMPIKILDLQENDTAVHTEDISSVVTDEMKAILILVKRISGTGVFRTYPRSDTQYQTISNGIQTICTLENRELMWSNSVANDDWDIYLVGYWIQNRTR